MRPSNLALLNRVEALPMLTTSGGAFATSLNQSAQTLRRTVILKGPAAPPVAFTNGRIHRMPVDVRNLPPEVARAAERARTAAGSHRRTPPDLTPLSPAASDWADWAIESGELTKALQAVAESDPDLAG